MPGFQFCSSLANGLDLTGASLPFLRPRFPISKMGNHEPIYQVPWRGVPWLEKTCLEEGFSVFVF